jgi:hypothetical protein
MNAQNAEMLDRMVKAGISQTEAENIVSLAATPDEIVDVDRLTKALEGVKDTFEAEVTDETPDVDAAIQEASDIVDAVTKGADVILAEQRGQYEALSKAILTMGQELQSLKGQIAGQAETVQKSLNSVGDAMNEPMMRKSVSGEAIPLPSAVTGTSATAPDLISKALDEIRGENVSELRAGELRQAVSLLESGASASEVASNFRINTVQ